MSVPAGNLSLGGAYNTLTQKQKYTKMRLALWQERMNGGWDAHYREINEFLNPRAGRFNNEDPNDGSPKHNSIYDSTGLRARRVLTAGLMSGHTSPARPWFRLTLPDKEMMERQAVKVWLDDSTKMLRDIFAKSNTYFSVQKIYRELVSVGTGANFMEDDFENVMHHTPLTCGEYAIRQNAKGRVDTIYRHFKMQALQMVKMFGLENCSLTVKNLYNNGNYLSWVPLSHAVQPREGRNPSRIDAKNMRFASCWWEEDNTGDVDRMLRESGYKRFPALTPRWDTTSGDTYGESPGMEVLGDVKMLMHQQLRKSQGIDYKVNPPLAVPTSSKENQNSRLPGGVMYYDPISGAGGAPVKSAFEVNLDLSHLLEDIVDIRSRIDRGFFVDLFLMIANIERSNVTAREIAEKQEEKLIMLGPVIEGLNGELLEPLINFGFDRMVETRILPRPPPELEGMDLQIEFVGVLAQAQRAVGINSVDRLVGTIGAIAQFRPEAVDKMNVDHIIDDYADMLGVNPEFIIANEEVAIIREQRAQQQQQMIAAEQAPEMANAAKTASETNVQQPSMLNSLMGYQ